jgi:DNA repair photolyase
MNQENFIQSCMIQEITAKSVLRKYKKLDSWFLTRYGINLYRGCTHNCVYCDGRAETYQTHDDFGRNVDVKTNAIELLDKELDPGRKRKPMPRSFMMLGGGVCDAYQPVEKKYNLARQTLELFLKYNHPVHVLTKSTLVERDLDLLIKINEQSKAMVSFSFSSTDLQTSRIFEPGVPSPDERLAVIKKIKQAGIACGMFLMPVIPFITDTPDMIKKAILKGKNAGIDFVVFGTMTMKPGRQKDYFLNTLKHHYPGLDFEYDMIYQEQNQWGGATSEYTQSVHQIFDLIAGTYKIPRRIPAYTANRFLSQNDLVMVILEQMDYLLKLKNQKSPYGYAAYSISKLQEPIDKIRYDQLLQIKGVGSVTAKIIREITSTGNCKYYNKLLFL